MSKADAWMPFYVADYLRDTMRLTRDQHGGYLLLLMACWCEGGRLPNDPAELAAIAKATPAEWRKLAPVLLRYFKIEGDQIVHGRVVEEHEKAARLAETRRQNGGKGGRPRKLTETETKPGGLANGKLNETPSPLPTELGAKAPNSDELAKANFVGSAEPMPTQPALIADESPAPAKPRFTPTKAELDAIWEITPKPGRERSSRKDLERALVAAMRRGHDPASVAAGVRAAYASTTYAGDHAKGVHRLIEADRWQTFVEEAAPAPAPAAWSGPWQLRAAVVDVAGEDVARGYVDPSVWRAEDRALVVRNAFMADRLRREAGPTLDRLKVNIVVSEGVAA
jgi:uncharacterized protein YdaU (DUF1376 family)